MRVLVTGGTGFVGCHTVAALVGHGHRVRLLLDAVLGTTQRFASTDGKQQHRRIR